MDKDMVKHMRKHSLIELYILLKNGEAQFLNVVRPQVDLLWVVPISQYTISQN